MINVENILWYLCPCCSNTDVEYRNRAVKLTITCSECANKIDIMEQQIAQLNDEIDQLNDKIDQLNADLKECSNDCNKL